MDTDETLAELPDQTVMHINRARGALDGAMQLIRSEATPRAIATMLDETARQYREAARALRQGR